MKAVFIPTQYTGPLDLSKIELEKLPDRLGIITTAQFSEKTKEIVTFLEQRGKECFIDKDKQRNAGQLLGCDQGAAFTVQDKVDAFLYVGSGDFHPLGVAKQSHKDVFLFNPVSSVFDQFDPTTLEKYEQLKKIKYTNFLHAQNIGILVSIKPGQYSFKQAQQLKEKLTKEGKQCYIFVFDELQVFEMENFPFIECWVNTACPRIADDRDKKNVIDMSQLV